LSRKKCKIITKRGPETCKIDQAVFEKRSRDFDWKVTREGGDLSSIGQLPSEWQEKSNTFLSMGEIIP